MLHPYSDNCTCPECIAIFNKVLFGILGCDKKEESVDKMSDESKIEMFDSQFLTPLISGIGMTSKKKIADTDYIIANMPNKIKVTMINNQLIGLTKLTRKGKR